MGRDMTKVTPVVSAVTYAQRNGIDDLHVSYERDQGVDDMDTAAIRRSEGASRFGQRLATAAAVVAVRWPWHADAPRLSAQPVLR